MKNQFSKTLAIATLLMGLIFTAFAQGDANAGKGPGAKPTIHTDANLLGTQVKLQCTVNGPSEFPNVTITNNSPATIAAGKKVFWQVNSSMKGSMTLQAPLAPGKSVKFDTEAKGNGGIPSAWYFK